MSWTIPLADTILFAPDAPDWLVYSIDACPWTLGQKVYVRNDPTVTDELETVSVVTGLRFVQHFGWRVFICSATEDDVYDHPPIPSHDPGTGDEWNADDADLSATSWAVAS